MIKNNKLEFYKLIFLILLLIIPWLIADYSDKISAEQLGTEDTSFYEINPCKVSLVEYLKVDFGSTFKNHYFFRYNNYSSIECFGKFSGMALEKNIFSISIGTNTFINLLLQTLFWVLIISFLKIDNLERQPLQFKFFTTLVTSGLLVFSIYSQPRFYEKNLYIFDFNIFKSYFLLFVIFFILISITIDIIYPRLPHLINYVPATFLLIGVYSGTNLSFFAIPIIFFGLISLFNKENLKLNLLTIIFLVFWINNIGENFTFKPDKLRGFVSSTYDLNSVIYHSLFFVLLLNFLIWFAKNFKDYFDFEKFKFTYSTSIILIFSFGLIGANIPIFNFFTYFYLGQQKYGVKYTNPFLVDIFNNNEKIPWRGISSSAESLGEFYGLFICLVIYSYVKNRKINLIESISFICSIFGLYFSNNKTVFLLIILFTSILINKNLNLSRFSKLSSYFAFILLLFYVIGFSNILYPYEVTSFAVYEQALKYKDLSSTSTGLGYIIEIYDSKNLIFFIFSFFSFIAYLLNRSELWGLFLSRYNPNVEEFILGSSPFNLGKHYSEIRINEPGSLLLPHSSVLTLLLYIGFLGVFLLFLLLIIKIKNNKENINYFGYFIIGYIVINLIKSDSINYFSSLLIYFILTYLIVNKKTEDIFD